MGVGVVLHPVRWRTDAESQQCVRNTKPALPVADDLSTRAALLSHCAGPRARLVDKRDRVVLSR
jgi:hypothetical protein